MKKRIFTLTFLIITLFCIGGYAQSYYYLPSTGTGAGYSYTTLGDTFNGWPNGMKDTLIKSKALPFAWTFYGQNVTSYRVSDNGYVTFDPSATQSDPNNVSLPSVTAPFNAIFAFWDNLVLYKPDAYSYLIHTWTYGTAPNRVFVIAWFQASKEPAGTTGSRFTFSIRLFETGPKSFDIVYDNYYAASNPATTSGTVGCQNGDGTIGTMVTGSPNMSYPTNLTSAQTDDVVYEFYYGTQSDYDLTVTKLTMPVLTKLNSTNAITGEIRNLGSIAINSFTLKYTVDGNTTSTPITVSIAPGETYDFSATPLTPTTGIGQIHSIKVWADGLNGTHVDDNPANDTAKMDLFYINGIKGNKRTLIEEATGTWCGYCPDGVLVLNDAKNTYGDGLVEVSHHNQDPMAFASGNTINSTYATFFPCSWVDRYKFSDATVVGLSRDTWITHISDRLAMTTPVNVSIKNLNYNEATRALDFDVEASFVDYAYGDLRISCLLTENYVSGTTTAWNQHNYYSKYFSSPQGGTSHPLYNAPEWMNSTAAGGSWFNHHVSRVFLSQTWGDYIDATHSVHAISMGSVLTKHYSITVDAGFNANQLNIVAFVNNYDADINNREILNVNEQKVTTLSVNEIHNNNVVSEIYPNPVQDYAYINFTIYKTSPVTLDVFDIMGKKVISKEQTKYASGSNNIYFNTSELPVGSYITVLKIGDTSYSRKFIK